MPEEPLTLEIQFRDNETDAFLEYATHRVMTDPAMLPHVGDIVALYDRERHHDWVVQRREFHFNTGLLIVRVYLSPKSAE
jgi:hypothetical protein